LRIEETLPASLASLVLWSDENAAPRAGGRLTVLFSNATAQIDDLAIETRMLFHGYDEPFDRNRFVGINWTPKLNANVRPSTWLGEGDAVSAKRCAVVAGRLLSANQSE
jgi:hypothetical protein